MTDLSRPGTLPSRSLSVGEKVGDVLRPSDMYLALIVAAVAAVGVVRRSFQALADDLGVGVSDLDVGLIGYLFVGALLTTATSSSFALYSYGVIVGHERHTMLEDRAVTPGAVVMVGALSTAIGSVAVAVVVWNQPAIGCLIAACTLTFWCGLARELLRSKVAAAWPVVVTTAGCIAMLLGAGIVLSNEGHAIAAHALAGADEDQRPAALLDFVVRPTTGTVVGESVCVVRVTDNVWITDLDAPTGARTVVLTDPPGFISSADC